MSTRTITKFLDPKDVLDAIHEVAEIFRHELGDVAIIGGVAMMQYGSDRLTKDVDVATIDEYPRPTLLRHVKKLPFGGVACTTSAGHPVDVVVREDEYRDLYREAVETAVDVGLPLRMVSREYLAALKMAAGRSKDVQDLKTLVALGEIDLLKTRSIVRRHLGEYAARELDSLFAEAEWEKSRER